MFVMILATLAVQIVIERATLIAVGDQPKSIPVFTDLPPIRIAGISIGYQILWIVGTSLLLIGLLVLFFQRTLVGRAMRACAINREAAALQGIPVSRMLALSFALSAALGALACSRRRNLPRSASAPRSRFPASSRRSSAVSGGRSAPSSAALRSGSHRRLRC
jgi:branched-subunit amino acid ABC-type transport system permease component